MTPAQANSYGWQLNWLALPNALTGTTLCSGQTTPGATNWQVYSSVDLYLDVNTSTCGFSSVPLYFTSIGGAGSHYYTQGATSIYFPTATGFRVYVRYNGGSITPAQAISWGWHLTWSAVGANKTAVRKYYDAGSQRVAMREDNILRWLLGDRGPSGLGSTAYTVYDTTAIGELRYLPWGGTRYSSGQTVTSYRFTGQREEAGIGLYYYGARAQWAPDDPALGRFVQHSRGFLTATDSARDRQHWVDSLTAHRPAASGVPSSAPAASAAPP